MPFWKRCLQSSTDVIIIVVINDYALLTNIQARWLYISQALFCKANTQLSSSNKLGWFAHLSSQSEHRICFILPARRFNHKITINMLYWPGVRLRWLDIFIFIDLAFLLANKNAKKNEANIQPSCTNKPGLGCSKLG